MKLWIVLPEQFLTKNSTVWSLRIFHSFTPLH